MEHLLQVRAHVLRHELRIAAPEIGSEVGCSVHHPSVSFRGKPLLSHCLAETMHGSRSVIDSW